MKYVYDYEKRGKIEKFDRLILMSKSPRRRDLLSFLNPCINSIEINEREIERKFMDLYSEDPFLIRAAKTCSEIAKAKSNVKISDKSLYISSDTMVVNEDKIYGKPANINEARSMFMSYFGKSHYVISAVCLREKSFLDVFFAIAEVRFCDYYSELDSAIENYLKEENVMDKAGSYGIQDLDPRFISYINGDYNTIIGLPVSELSRRIVGV